MILQYRPPALTLPRLAFTPVFNTLASCLIPGDSVTLVDSPGILCMVAGVFLVAA